MSSSFRGRQDFRSQIVQSRTRSKAYRRGTALRKGNGGALADSFRCSDDEDAVSDMVGAFRGIDRVVGIRVDCVCEFAA